MTRKLIKMLWKEILGTEVLWFPSCPILIPTALVPRIPLVPKEGNIRDGTNLSPSVLSPALQPQGCLHLISPQSAEAILRALLNPEPQSSLNTEFVFIKDTKTNTINIKM